MKNPLLHFIIISLLFAGCEKSEQEDYVLKNYGDALEDIGYSVSIASDGYIIAGQFTDIPRDEANNVSSANANKNLGVLKTNWAGNLVWKISAGGKYSDWGKKVLQLDDGSMICVGTFTDTTTAVPEQTDIFVVKISSSGEIVWQKKYSGAGNQTGIDIIKSSDGFIILGSTDAATPPSLGTAGNTEGKAEIFLLKISDSGDKLGVRACGYPNNDLSTTIKYDIGGNFIILATTEKSDPDMDKNNLLLIRINNNMDIVDSRIIGDATDEYAADMEVLDNSYLIAGTIGKDGDNQQTFVRTVKRDLHATQDQPVRFQIDEASTSVKAMAKYGVDRYILAGLSGSSGTGDILIFGIDASGNPVDGMARKSGSTGLQIAYDVVSGDDGYIIAVGKNSYELNSMISMLKFKF